MFSQERDEKSHLFLAISTNNILSQHVRSLILRFVGKNKFLGAKIFVFIICLKQNLLGTTKFWGSGL